MHPNRKTAEPAGAQSVEYGFLMGMHEYACCCSRELAQTNTVWQSIDSQSRALSRLLSTLEEVSEHLV